MLEGLTLFYSGDDDYFSADLPDETVSSFWSKFQKPVLLVPSGDDEHVPKSIDVGKSLSRWSSFCSPGIFSPLSGLIPGANHNVAKPEAQRWLANRVTQFLQSLDA